MIHKSFVPLFAAGVMLDSMVPEWEIPVPTLYMASPQRRPDEAIRTATFSEAAKSDATRAPGPGSTLMIGLDAVGVHREFSLAEVEVPVTSSTTRPKCTGRVLQKPRRSLAEVLDLVYPFGSVAVPVISQDDLQVGVNHSPEFICLKSTG